MNVQSFNVQYRRRVANQIELAQVGATVGRQQRPAVGAGPDEVDAVMAVTDRARLLDGREARPRAATHRRR